MVAYSDEQRRGAVLGMWRTRGMNSKFLVCADPRVLFDCLTDYD